MVVSVPGLEPFDPVVRDVPASGDQLSGHTFPATRMAPGPRRDSRRVLVYVAFAAGLGLWAAVLIYATLALLPPDHYLMSYYAADYHFGFLRRGLAGELAGPINDDGFFRRAAAMRWALTVTYLAAIAALCWWILRGGRSERRIQLALAIPVLSFGVPFAVASARPDLIGATTMVALAITVSARPRWTLPTSAAYGVMIALAAFIHEAIPFEFALGAVLAIGILANGLSRKRFLLCSGMAVGPGLIAAGVIADSTRHDLADRLCSQIQHRQMPDIVTLPELVHYVRTGQSPMMDYHDWVCGWYLHTFNYSLTQDLHEVAAIGGLGLAGSLLLGIVAVASSIAVVQYISRVPFAAFLAEVRGRWQTTVVAAALMLPLFGLGFDWTRWMVIVALNVGIVYLLYIRDRPEFHEPTSRSQVIAFGVCTVLLALIPLGIIPGGSPNAPGIAHHPAGVVASPR